MSQKDYDMVARWYVVHTYSGYENKVKDTLEKVLRLSEILKFLKIDLIFEENIEEEKYYNSVYIKKDEIIIPSI